MKTHGILVDLLFALSNDMWNVAKEMEYHEDADAEMKAKAEELKNASEIVLNWANAIGVKNRVP